MKITGAVEDEAADLRRNRSVKILDQPRRRRKTQTWAPVTQIDRRQVERRLTPGTVKIEMCGWRLNKLLSKRSDTTDSHTRNLRVSGEFPIR